MKAKKLDYFFPTKAIHPLLKTINLGSNDLIFDPCAGDGGIAQCLRDNGHDELVWTGDIDLEIKNLSLPGFDATDHREWKSAFGHSNADWVITNPPYRRPDCDQIIQNAWAFANKGVAMMLRLTYLEPHHHQGRSNFLKLTPLTNLIILYPNPKFVAGGSVFFPVPMAWFVWKKGGDFNTKITYCTDWND